MCGISGGVGNIKIYKKDILSMSNSLIHRGPDDKGFYSTENVILNHNRLSIIDLTKKGSQPMQSFDGRFIIIFNGEIYNYVEILKNLGISTKSKGDTRALVELFSKKKINCLEYLRGMFSFVILDKKLKKIYLVRDRYGIKPLYYYNRKDVFFYSSEIKPLLKFVKNLKPNSRMIKEYLNYSLVDHSKETFFENIFQLMPGEYMEVNFKGEIISKKKWYELKNKVNLDTNKIKKNPINYLEEFSSIFEETMKIHSRSDVDIGVSISGGLDSQAILSELIHKKKYKSLNTYNFYFMNKKFSEKEKVQKFLKKTNVLENYVLFKSNFIKQIKENIKIQEQPFGGVATMAMRSLYSRARGDNVKVLLNGSGADDYLSGSNREILYFLAELYHQKKFDKLNYEIEYYCKNYSIDKKTLLKKINNLTKNFYSLGADGTSSTDNLFLNKETKLKNKIMNYNTPNLKQILIDRITKNKLPRNLRYEDRNSMCNSLEVRVPFLDHKLLEYCLNLPNELVINKSIGKVILREYVKNKFKNKFSYEIKKSIQTPQTSWFISKLGQNELINLLKKKNSFISNYLDVKKSLNFVKSKRFNKIKNSNFLWQWLSLEEWYENFF